MGDNPSRLKGDALPVERVVWKDCQEFCTNTGLSLPTEAQWEYACRAGTPGPFAGTGDLDDMGWYSGNSGGKAHSVGEKQPNQFGLHDMHGNVWEWCRDWYHGDFYRESTGARDPLCENSDLGMRVVRGGSWDFHARDCRPACRYWFRPSHRFSYLGFRPAAPYP